MRKLFKLTAFLLVGIVLFGCKKEDPVPPLGNLMVVVTDASTGSLLTDVTATLMNADKNGEASAQGVVFKDVKAGDYLVKLEKSGYASIYVAGRLDMEAGADRAFAYNATVYAEMPQAGAKVSGLALYAANNQDASEFLPAAGAVLTLQLDGNFVDNGFKATVKEDGSYLFENLPAETSFTITLQDVEIDGAVYAGNSVSGTSKAAGEELKGMDVRYQPSSGNLELLYYPIKIDTNQDIVFKFAEAVDVSRVGNGDITAQLNSTTILVTATWSDDNKTLTIKNTAGKEWREGSSILISLPILYNLGGKQFNISSDYTITVNEPKVTEITGFTGQKVGNYTVALEWNAPSVETSYRIYRKAASDDVYTIIRTYNYIPSEGITMASLNDSSVDFNDEEYYDYQIEAYNGVSTSARKSTRVTK